MLVDSCVASVGLLSEPSPIDSLLKLLPVGMLVDSCVGLLLELLPIGTWVDLYVGALMESLSIGLLSEPLGVGMLSRSLGVGALVKLCNGMFSVATAQLGSFSTNCHFLLITPGIK